MTLWVAAGLGIVQGLAELFPFSSLGLLVLLPHLLQIPVPTGPEYLPFLVALHVGTVMALVATLPEDWLRLIRGFRRWLAGQRTPEGRLAWLVIWATVPAGLVGFMLRNRLALLFGDPLWATRFLLLNAAFMAAVDYVRSRKPLVRTSWTQLSVAQALKIGCFQVFALIPGLSRSGLTIGGGVLSGLDYQSAAHFSFLLATPIILAAGLVELPHLAHAGGAADMLGPSLVGGAMAALTAWLSARFLLRYFRRHRFGGLVWASALIGALGWLALSARPH
ncbi:MAG: undecaprenyl-diphosphate phosphatase [Firmicutes bacterium]|nr:undecaprenyl-diphosphate phosphatase [Bacillota bacterium]